MKVDNIEKYTLSSLKALQDEYETFLEKSNGIDPDFPHLSFNDKGKKIDVNGGKKSILDDKTKKLIDKIWRT